MSGWLALLGAGLFEVAWAYGLKYSDGLTRFWPTAATAAAIALSFGLMAILLPISRTFPEDVNVSNPGAATVTE